MTQVDLATQAKGLLPSANVVDLVQALIDIGTLQGESGGDSGLGFSNRFCGGRL